MERLTLKLKRPVGLWGAYVESCSIEEMSQGVLVRCRRDRRYKVKEPISGTSCTVDHYVKRRLQDLPVSGRPCTIEVELAKTRDKEGRRLIEETEYVAKGGRYTARFCKFISGLCRHMSIHAVSQHLVIRWETVKNIDREYLRSSLPVNRWSAFFYFTGKLSSVTNEPNLSALQLVINITFMGNASMAR